MVRYFFPSLIGALLLISAVLHPALAGTKGGTQMKVTSQAFEQGEMIQAKYACTGENISPPIEWQGAPEGTRSITLIAEDPDAPMGTWVHWVYYDIPPQTTRLPENIPGKGKPVTGGTQGINDSLTMGYEGPCPPSGTHRYFFRVYAADTEINLPPGANKQEVLQAMEGHLLGMGEIMGRFRK